MSTNFCRSELHIHLSPTQPATYYGWYISRSTDAISMSVHPFRRREQREAFVSLVGRAMNDPAIAQATLDQVAAYLACTQWGGYGREREQKVLKTFNEEAAQRVKAGGGAKRLFSQTTAAIRALAPGNGHTRVQTPARTKAQTHRRGSRGQRAPAAVAPGAKRWGRRARVEA